MRSLISVGLILMTAVNSVGAAQHIARQPTEEQQAEIDQRARMRSQVDAHRALQGGRVTIREAITIAGGRLTLDPSPNIDAYEVPDLATLRSHSILVILGRPYAAHVQLSDAERRVVTRYAIQVDEVLQRDRDFSPLLAQVSVDVPAGRVTLPEGIAETVNGLELTIGAQYVFFLQRPHRAEVATVLAGSTSEKPPEALVVSGLYREGLFRVEGTTLRSLVLPTADHFKRHYDGLPAATFLAHARAAQW